MPLLARTPRRRPTAALLLALLLSPAVARGWGFEAHRLVNARAADALPEPLGGLFRGNVAVLRQHAVDPDLWKVHREGEGPNHYFDLDVFDDVRSGEVPSSEKAHLKRHGAAAAEHGRLPWRAGEAYRELVSAFRTRNVPGVLEAAAVLGHYVADAHVPLHATDNHDGQHTGQQGLHARWEIDLFARYERQIATAVEAGDAGLVSDPVRLTLDVLRRSLDRVPELLAADRAAAGQRDYLETATDDRYGDGYYSRLYELEGESVVAQLEEAAVAVSSLWLSAWHEAGRPRLDGSFRVSHVRGESRLVVAVLAGAGAGLVDAATDRGAMPHLDALRREGSVGRVRPPFPARGPATRATLWTGAWPVDHGVVGDGATHPSGTVLETTPGARSTALGAEPFWVTAAREGVETVVVDVPQAAPFTPYLEERRFGGDYGGHLILMGRDTANVEAAVLGARNLAPRPAGTWTGREVPPGSLGLEVPLGGTTLPGLLYDDPDDPGNGLDTLALSWTRSLEDAAVLKPLPAGRGPDAFVAVRLPTAERSVHVHFRLFDLSPDGREIVLWHSAEASTIASRERVAEAVADVGGLLPGGSPNLYTQGHLGPLLWEGGDGTAERRYLETVGLAVRQHSRLASRVLDRTRWGLAVLALPFPEETLRLWLGRLDPALPGHDAGVAVRLRPFLDEALRLTDRWVGEIARRNPPDAGLAVVGDRGLHGVNRRARPNVALRDAGLLATDHEGRIDLGQTKAVYAPADGGFLVMNSDSRPEGIQPHKGSSLVEAGSIGAMRELRDPASGEAVIAALTAAGTRGAPPGIGGASGGFLYLRPAPGVSVSAETAGPSVEAIPPTGDALDPSRPSADGFVVLTGRGVAGGRVLGEVRPVDLAPTFTALLGIAPPPQAAGGPLPRALAERSAAATE